MATEAAIRRYVKLDDDEHIMLETGEDIDAIRAAAISIGVYNPYLEAGKNVRLNYETGVGGSDEQTKQLTYLELAEIYGGDVDIFHISDKTTRQLIQRTK